MGYLVITNDIHVFQAYNLFIISICNCLHDILFYIRKSIGKSELQKGSIAMKKVTAGRDNLGEFAPQFAALNDDVLFGEVWSRENELEPKVRSMITLSALISGGNFEQVKPHLEIAKANGVTKDEIVEIITHLAFYVGWPKAWSAFNLAKEIFGE